MILKFPGTLAAPYITLLKNALAIICIALIVVSCNSKEDPDPLPNHHRYYPLQVGLWRIYDVDSIQYWGSTNYPSDTARFQLKEEIVSEFTDNTGVTAYRVETSIRATETDAWQPKFSSVCRITQQRAEQMWNNNRYIKLIFPVREGQTWDANVFNNEDPERFKKSRYVKANQPDNINGKAFDSVAVVQVQQYSDFVQEEVEKEIYATGVGLIRHEWKELRYDVDKDSVFDKLIRGFIYTKSLRQSGK